MKLGVMLFLLGLYIAHTFVGRFFEASQALFTQRRLDDSDLRLAQ